MKKRVAPFVGSRIAFYEHLIEQGLYTSNEIQTSIENSTSKYDSNERWVMDVYAQTADEIQKSLDEWTPHDDIRLLTILYDHSVVYITSTFKCSEKVIESRLDFLFGTSDLLNILSIPKEQKDEVFRRAMETYDRWVDNIEFDKLVEEFLRAS